MVVTWTTYNSNDDSFVIYDKYVDDSDGFNFFHFNQIQQGYVTKFVDGGNERRIHFIHRVILTNLSPFTLYCKIY